MANQISIGREAAIALAKSKWWEGRTHREIAIRGMSVQELCLPFDVLHESVEKALERSVFTHEFASLRMLDELLGNVPAPSLADIIEMIPEEKRLFVVT